MTDCAVLERLEAPNEVKTVLVRLRDVLAEAQVRSAILTGSTARNELSYAYQNGQCLLRSDIELYVVSDTPARTRRSVRASLDTLEREMRRTWPGFHIDTAFLTRQQLQRLRPYIRHFELKQNGLTLVGEPLIDLVPQVSPRNLDWRELNDVVLWRIAALLCAIDPRWLVDRAPLSLRSIHALSRGVLDLTLWSLPGHGVLLPSFLARVTFWKSSEGRELLRETPLPAVSVVEACLRARRTSGCDVSADELLEAAVSGWCWAHAVVVGSVAWSHAGSGAGFTRPDAARRARCAVRVLGSHPSLAKASWDHGYAAPAAAIGKELLLAAHLFRRRDDPVDLLGSLASKLGVFATSKDPLGVWVEARRSFLCYLDAALARPEWAWRVAEDCAL